MAWRWVFVGVVLLVGGNLGAASLLGERMRQLATADRPLAALAMAAGVPLVIFFAGGFIVGKLSAGRTVREPALAAVFSVLILFGVQLQAEMVNIAGLLIGTPFCFGAAYLGGTLGER